MTSLSQREQRLTALFILLLLLAGVWQFVIAPIADGFAARSEQRRELQSTIEHNRRLIASIPRLRRRVEEQRPQRAQLMLAASSRAVAGDLLRQRLQRSFEAAGASLGGVGGEDLSGDWAGASAEGTVTLGQLIHILDSLQNQSPYLVVTSLTVVADRAFQYGKLDVMSVRIDVAVPYTPTA